MTEPPQPPVNPDEPWNSGDPGYPPPQDGGQAYPGPSQGGAEPYPGPQQGGPAQPYPYPQQGDPSQPYPYPQQGDPSQPYPQQGYGQASGYPQGGYPGSQYPPAPPAGFNLVARLGPRLVRRPEARFGSSLAGAGIVLVLIGILVWAGGYLISGFHVHLDSDTGAPSTSGEGRRFLGAALSAVLVVAGYALLIIRRRGPLATAGAVASAIGVPLTILFVSLDLGGTLTGAFPVNIDALFIISIIVWLISYFAIPGAQGRAFYLGLAATYLYGYVALKAAGDTVTRTAFSAVNSGGLSSADSDQTTVTVVALIFGLVYYAIAAFLDKRGRGGAAVALVFAGFAATVSGVLAGASDFGLAGTGVLLLVLGAVLAWYGGYFGRRFTTWVWSAGFVLGIVLILAKVSPNNYTAAGVSLLVIGAIVVAGAQLLSSATHEQPDIEEAKAPAAAA